MFKPPAIRRIDLKEYRDRLSDNESDSRFCFVLLDYYKFVLHTLCIQTCVKICFSIDSNKCGVHICKWLILCIVCCHNKVERTSNL